MFFKEVGLTEENIKILIDFSREWEKENSTYGYRANTKEDLTGNRIFFACDHEQVIGYLFGNFFDSKRMQSIMPDHTTLCFSGLSFDGHWERIVFICRTHLKG